mgnify:CR=1 FL=1|jgi:hypothetical protein
MGLVLIVIGAPCIFAFGGYLMKRLDDFLGENTQENQEEKTEEPSCIMLTGEMTDEEMLQEIRDFCGKHGEASVFLCKKKEKFPDL